METFFWAMLTGCDITGLRHHFVRVIPDASLDGPDFILGDGPAYRIAGAEPETGYAREANGARPVPAFTVALVNFIGYDRDDAPAYLFQYIAAPLDPTVPIHDHRSNENGGFAFAVHHSGTSLPQMEWAV